MAHKPTVCFDEIKVATDSSRYRLNDQQMATITIFGATGDLAGRKLFPAIYNLWHAGFLPKRIAVVGVARKEKTDAQFRDEMCQALKKFSRTVDGLGDACDPFVSNLYYQQCEFNDPAAFVKLRERLEAIEQKNKMPSHRLHYLAVAPEYFAPIIEQLGGAGLTRNGGGGPWSRVVIEKPFGHDLDSARALTDRIAKVLREEQVYRIDHYLGKETVQNIFSFRFGNAIFEPLFNQKYVDHVQITMAETVGMEGRRGAFYDTNGALRDVVQNHLLQLLCLVAMEPPALSGAKHTRDEKVKVLSSIDVPKDDPFASWCVRGQYGDAPGIKGYLAEEGVAKDSVTETYVALRLRIDNWRWAGVPFLLRTGKCLKERVTEIAVQFKQPPTHFFRDLGIPMPQSNMLAFRIQPDEAISLRFNAKQPGMEMQIQPVNMDFTYDATFDEALPEAYERLLLDALRGDSTLFMRSDEIDYAWQIATTIADSWKGAPKPLTYAPGSWGPEEAEALFGDCRGRWRTP
ncbi:MAG TPA: glucose-6-phosphate dehydrogenase [Candidatus Hydrogenedentes bacterium]|nr:glucose-6-phosphate dehydrogenase [Candidatus Hydrogenedentota bacterium]